MNKSINAIDTLKLDEFVDHIRGEKYVYQNLIFPWGQNGFYTDTLDVFSTSYSQLPKVYVQDFYFLYILKHGRIVKFSQAKKVDLQGKNLYVSCPGQMKNWKAVENAEGYILVFSKGFLKNLRYNKNMLTEFPFLVFPDKINYSVQSKDFEKCLDVLANIYEAYIRKEAYDYELIQLWVTELLIRIKKYNDKNNREHLGDDSANETSVGPRFVQLLEDHFTQGIKKKLVTNKGVAEFAKDLNVHPNHLNREIKKHYGKSTKTVIIERYLLAAKCLILQTDLTIQEICYTLDFNNPPYFGRFFKKYTGMSPLQFRKKNSKLV
ncbi:helix-turn-helix transcriptional regulator [Aquimarina sp. U1-2]|uniref:helix-turn-helix domain-containing protein n=1 Tax=Aquimarina sp. U1-2 TaxID=2823141 RepID=UPI001AECEBF4|nr:AraC family transcriptional regulator [Aquimarina sp. U1-2]MBP2831229.1 helix-turn-helix transcriptional regulator [Aquimarina sp. U1-2]